MKNSLELSRLMEVLHYEPNCGTFTWLVVPAKCTERKAGDVAGHVDKLGYRTITVDGVRYKAHRLAWLFMTGNFPALFIDHINGCAGDNRYSNLREANRNINAQNMRNGTGELRLLGVCRFRHQFQASIKVNGKTIYLGHYVTKEDASEAYLNAKRKLHAGCTI